MHCLRIHVAGPSHRAPARNEKARAIAMQLEFGFDDEAKSTDAVLLGDVLDCLCNNVGRHISTLDVAFV